MVERKCDNCIHRIDFEFEYFGEIIKGHKCEKGVGINKKIVKCNAYDEKPKDNSALVEKSQKLETDPTADASRTFCFNFDCKKRDKKEGKPKECMIGKCESRIKKPTSQPTYS